MLKLRIIRPSINPYSSPIILVKKLLLEILYGLSSIEKITIPDKFMISIIDDLLDKLGGATIFTKLGLKPEYHQIHMRTEDIPKTDLWIH